jgi:nucleoside-diphosphate-sugar epimerase
MNRTVFITGATGYIGSRLIPLLSANGFEITALVRKGSENKIKSKCRIITGNPFDSDSFKDKIKPCETFIQLLGAAHPSPSKAEEFKKIDLVSAQESVKAAIYAGIEHFIYLSVAEPAPVMKEYIAVRKESERLIREAGFNATFIKPWYVLGPGHRWPYLIFPFYWMFMIFPPARETAKRLYPVKLKQVLNAILYSAKNPPEGIRIFDTAKMKNLN